MPSFWDNLRFGGAEEGQAGQNYDENFGAESQDMVLYVSFPPPTAGADFPGVIVVQEAFGVNDHIQKVCDRLAAEGFHAIAPAFFHREHPHPKLGYGDEDVPARTQYMSALRDEQIIDDINQTVLWTQSNQYFRTNGKKIGIIGFCVGGRIAYLGAAACPGLSAAVCYYPGRVTAPFGDGPAPIDMSSQITIPVMGNFGGQDQNPSPEDVGKMDAALSAAGVTHDFKSYADAGHGFNCDERGSYHQASAEDAWARSIAFLKQNLA